MYRFIDLFCGIGGFRVALEKKGFECVYSSDIDKHVQEAYFKNFGERPEGDITQIPTKRIPKHDVLCAGFPCQSFSISGKQGGIKDDRGKLFYEIIRIAEYHKPEVLLLENVKNLLSIDDGKAIKTIESKIEEVGYNVQKHVLNASYFGIPQARSRVYFVCLKKNSEYGYKLKYSPPRKLNKKIFLKNIIEENVDKRLFIDRQDIVLKKLIETQGALKPIKVGIVNKGGQGERIYSPNGHAITLSAYGGGVGAKTGLYLVKEGIRRLSINECKKLMGLPKDHYVSSGNEGYKQLGNAVITTMIGYVYDSIKFSKILRR